MKNKKQLKRKAQDEEKEEIVNPPSVRQSDEPPPKKVRWTNKQRVLVLALRGLTYLNRHLMLDLRALMPHSKKDSKVEKGLELKFINEIAESMNCNKCVLFENRRKTDLYMWFVNVPNGPTAKFAVENVYTMKELKLTGNCLKGSRPILSFDEAFKTEPQYRLLQELFVQIFGVPNHHPKSQPFTDHVINFNLLDGKIWFRNYQILSQDGALAEIGPRFVLNPIKIFAGSFGGEALWENPQYVSRTMFRRSLNQSKAMRYVNRKGQKDHHKATQPEISYDIPVMEEVFRSSGSKKVGAGKKEATKTGKKKKGKKSKPINKISK